MNTLKTEELLHDIIKNSGSRSLKDIAEFIINDCKNPECEVCKELKEALDEEIEE